MITRCAQESDASALAQLARETFVEAFGAQNRPEHVAQHCQASFSNAKQAQEIADATLATFVAEAGDTLAGYAQARRYSPHADVEADRPTELCRLYVRSAWHGRGVAQRLMAHVHEVASHARADVLWLGVWEDNPRGIAFYRKYGFEVVGRQIFYVGADPQNDLVMAMNLSG